MPPRFTFPRSFAASLGRLGQTPRHKLQRPTALILAACDNDPELAPETEEASGAQGEILGGTISDEMLPLDTVRSQAPTRGDGGEGGDEEGEDGENAVEDEDS